jgi:hypothetical protein
MARWTFVATRQTLSHGGLLQADALSLELRPSAVLSVVFLPVPADRADGEESFVCTKLSFAKSRYLVSLQARHYTGGLHSGIESAAMFRLFKDGAWVEAGIPNQSYHAGDLRTVRKNPMLWPIHSCAPVRRSSSSTFWRDSTVPVVFSSSGMRFRSRSSA